MKYYCIFAINKENPNDILGMAENSFSMSWEKDRVNLWCPSVDELKYQLTNKQRFESEMKERRYERKNIKGRKRVLRKRYSDLSSRYYNAYGRSKYERKWQWVKHYSKFVKCPEGYETIVCRANSKYCPVRVDLSIREGMDKGILEYKKYDYRNAKFEIKS